MPGPRMVIDTLLAIGDKAVKIFRARQFASAGNNNNEPGISKRYEGLAAQWMMFCMVEPARHFVLLAFNQADNCARFLARRFDARESMKALGHAIVDKKRILVATLDDFFSIVC